MNYYDYENDFVPQLSRKLKKWQYQMGYYLDPEDLFTMEYTEIPINTKIKIVSEYELPTKEFKRIMDELLKYRYNE